MDLPDSELEAFLEEALSPERMAEIEHALRSDSDLLLRLRMLNGRRDGGQHSVGAIWRRHGVTCPTRDQLGSFLLEALDDDFADYIRFHIEQVGCRCCLANLTDLRRQQEDDRGEVVSRRRRYFESSAGHLHGR